MARARQQLAWFELPGGGEELSMRGHAHLCVYGCESEGCGGVSMWMAG